ncbi:MAG: hypothetical protein E7549_05125 [Ruminococcaceae bacterium]|nr:hypothetical protein [Oscillospiraceae bacterium]
MFKVSLRETLQGLVNKSREELFVLAKMSMARVLPYCRNVDNTTDGTAWLASVLMTAVAADGEVSRAESRFIAAILGWEEEQLAAWVPADREQANETVDRFVDALDAETKAAACLLISAVLACDGHINFEENAFIRKMIA